MTESAPWHKHLPSAWVHENPALAALMQAESLTAALKALAAPFSVRLLHLGAVAWQPHEAGFIALAAATPLHGREVLLCLDDVPVVWARSVCARRGKSARGSAGETAGYRCGLKRRSLFGGGSGYCQGA